MHTYGNPLVIYRTETNNELGNLDSTSSQLYTFPKDFRMWIFFSSLPCGKQATVVSRYPGNKEICDHYFILGFCARCCRNEADVSFQLTHRHHPENRPSATDETQYSHNGIYKSRSSPSGNDLYSQFIGLHKEYPYFVVRSTI